MRQLAMLLLLCSTFASRADLLDAMKAYENKDFTKAVQEFAALLPLANEQAAFNLGAMAANAEGQSRDLVKALAYFEFAASREHPSAKTMADKIRSKLSEAEQQQAGALLAQLQQQVRVKDKAKPELMALFGSDRKAIKRIAPEYPKDAAARGLFGSVIMRLLVNELRPQDRVAIVAYAGAAGLVLPSTSGDEKARQGVGAVHCSASVSAAWRRSIRLASTVSAPVACQWAFSTISRVSSLRGALARHLLAVTLDGGERPGAVILPIGVRGRGGHDRGTGDEGGGACCSDDALEGGSHGSPRGLGRP